MFKLLKLRLKKEIEELKSLHRIEINEKEAAFKLLCNEKDIQFSRKERDLTKDHELKLKEVTTLLKLDSEQRIKQLELDSQKKINALEITMKTELMKQKEELLDSNYKKLTESMSKLHEEGNVTTRFTQDLAIKMLEGMPKHKVQTKVITKGSDRTEKTVK